MRSFFLLSLILFSNAAMAKDGNIELRWLVSHDATNEEAIENLKAFGKSIAKASNDKLKLRIVYYPETKIRSHGESVKQVMDEKVDATQVPAATLGVVAPEFKVLSEPFLFKDASHVAKTLDGAPAADLANALLTASGQKVRPVGHVYCGGFRGLFGTNNLSKEVDFSSLKISPPVSAQSEVYFKSLGVAQVKASDNTLENIFTAMNKNELQLTEAEPNRLGTTVEAHKGTFDKIKFFNETNHSIFISTIVLNEKWFAKLTPELKSILQSEMSKFVAIQRKMLKNWDTANRERLRARNIEFVKPSPKMLGKLQKMPTDYDSSLNESQKALITKIQAL